MEKIINYIHYRFYKAYEKEDDSPRFSSAIVMGLICMIMSTPFGLFFMKLTDGGLLSYSIPVGTVLLLSFRFFYNKERVNFILKNNKLKKGRIPFFFIFLLIPLSFALAMIIYFTVVIEILDYYDLYGILLR